MSSPQVPSKRKRKTLSCLQCRRRKLRCDRNHPSCSRCQGQGVECIFENPPENHRKQTVPNNNQSVQRDVSTPASLHAIVSPPQGQYQYGHPTATRKPTLEAPQSQGTWGLLGDQAVGSLIRERPAVMSDSLYLLEPPKARKTENVIFRGKNFRTQYYGGSNPTSLIGDFPELRSFMQDSIKQHPSLPRVQRELKSLQVKWKIERRTTFSSNKVELLELLHLFPDQEAADHLIKVYLDTIETTYRIVHVPTFWKEYRNFLNDRKSAKPAFLVLMLLMMSTVSCVYEEKPTHVGDSAVARERAALWIEVSERWLRNQSQKQIYLSIWQIRCLLLLSKQVNVIKKKRIWTEAGTLLRQAMAAGFHRDPSILSQNGASFDHEMRRRLWATISELELQASIDRGMPSASIGISSDCATVQNVDDDDLKDGATDDELRPKAGNLYTQTSYLHISRSSFALRTTLNSVVNSLDTPLRWEQVIDYEDLIRAELEALPSWTRTISPGGTGTLSGSLLHIQLQQFLILLHMPFARKIDSNSRCSVSRMICFQAAQNILDEIRQLAEYAYFFILLSRQEYFRAALSVCHCAYVSHNLPSDLFGMSITPCIQYFSDSLILFEHRVTRLGTDFTRYWYISAARSLLFSTVDPSDETRQKQQAIELVARQYYRIRGSQEDILSVKAKLNLTNLTSTDGLSSVADLYDMPCQNGTIEPVDFPLESLEEEFFFGDPAAWTFENFEFM